MLKPVMHLENKTEPLLIAILFFYTNIGFGLSSDRQKNMDIKASGVEINDIKGVSKYSGPVTITQGSMKITARTVIVYHNKKREITRITAYGRKGRRATYKVRPDKERYDLTSRANRLEYFPRQNLMDMFGNASVKQGDRNFKSNRIKYNLVSNKVMAGAKLTGKQKPGRVNITIGPKK